MARTQIATSGLSDLGSPVATKLDVENALALYATETTVKTRATVSVLDFVQPTDDPDDWGPVIQRAFDLSPVGACITMPPKANGNGYLMRTGAVMHKTQSFESYATFVVQGAIGGFQLEGAGSSIRGVQISGDRTPGNQGIVAIGAKCSVINCFINLCDNGIIVAPGGYEQNIFGNSIRNSGSRHIWVQSSSVGPLLMGNSADRDGDGNPVPSVAGLHIQAAGTFVLMCDFLHGKCLIEPGSTDVTWIFISSCSFDSNPTESGILIRNNSSYNVFGIYVSDSWTSTCLRGIETSGTGRIEEVLVRDHVAKNIFAESLCFRSGDKIMVDNPSIIASAGTIPNAASIYINASGFVQITNGRVNAIGQNANTTPYAHVLMDMNAGQVCIDGTSFDRQIQTKVIYRLGGMLIAGNIPGAGLQQSGITQVLQGNTTVVVPHGLDYSPDRSELMVWPISNSGGPWWVDTITGTTFTVQLANAVSANAVFGWSCTIKGISG